MLKNKIHKNPFRIEDGFRIIGSITSTKKISGKEDLFTLQEISEYLDMPSSDIVILAEHEKVPHINFGGRLFFPLAEIDAVSPHVFKLRLETIKSEEGIEENATPPFAVGVMVLGATVLAAALLWRRV